MKPKSYKILKEGIAEEVGVHPAVVDDFISFYFGKIRNGLSNLEYPRIHIDGLGTFYLRKNKLENAVKKNKSILGNLTKRTYLGFAKSEDIQKNILQMETALSQIENDIKKKKEFKSGKKVD